jgi:hypothetical protein
VEQMVIKLTVKILKSTRMGGDFSAEQWVLFQILARVNNTVVWIFFFLKDSICFKSTIWKHHLGRILQYIFRRINLEAIFNVAPNPLFALIIIFNSTIV